ncbi:MAG: tyrosine-type recombinase/integrase [Streptosporangiaceae bacterium]
MASAAFAVEARHHRLFAFYHLAAYTGARRGELLNLRWTDIDLGRRQVTITGSTAVIDGQRINGTTKSGRKRTIGIDEETVAVLTDHRRAQLDERDQLGDFWRGTPDGLVFTSGWGDALYPDTLTTLMSKIVQAHNARAGAAPLPHARLHDLRHYADGWVMCPAVTFPLAGVAELVLRSA